MAARNGIKLGIRWMTPDLQEIPNSLGNFDFITSQLLLQRGIVTHTEADKFLRPQLTNLDDPTQLTDLNKAAERIHTAVVNKEFITVYGDYDVDGVTSATLLTQTLKQLGAHASVYLPERLKEGYGLNPEAIRQLRQDGTDLLITVDNGTTNVDDIAIANSLGMEVIVVDHHQIPEQLPAAYAIINPQRDADSPFRNLAAVGVTYLLARALIGDTANQFLDLVALGTVADVVPLVGNNRTLVVAGLELINHKTKRPGIATLIEVAGLINQKIDVYHIGFQLGPRLNAAGRIDHARIAFDLLNAADIETAKPLAQTLNQLNVRRQELTDRLLQEAKIQAMGNQDKIIIAGGPDWSVGVVGIVAGRLVEEFSKPVIVFEYQDEICKGSCRSVDGVHIVELLNQATDFIEHFGGHAKAAGLSVAKHKFDDFRQALIKIANDTIDPVLLSPSLRVDVVLELAHVTPRLLATVESFAPFGFGNPTPVFGATNVELVGEVPGMNGAFLDLIFQDDTNRQLTLKVFGDWAGLSLQLATGNRYDIAFTIGTWEWRGRKLMQTKLAGIRPTTSLSS